MQFEADAEKSLVRKIILLHGLLLYLHSVALPCSHKKCEADSILLVWFFLLSKCPKLELQTRENFMLDSVEIHHNF